MIVCKELYKRFGEVEAVNGVSMQVPDGTFLGLLGPNGTGKTTLMRMLTGLLVPDSGTVDFDGRPMDRNAIDVKQSTGCLLAFLGLDSVRGRVSQNLSGGMKRKLMIAKAMIHNPQYLFLDEPTVGIDPNARRDIWEFLRMQHKEGKTILLTTHYIEEAQHLCDDVMLIDSGKIFREDTPQALISEIGSYKVEYDTGEKMASEFFRDISAAKSRAAELDYPCSVFPSTLEDVFFHYTSKGVEGWK